MIKNDIIRKILHLVKQGKMSQRQIAKRLGVSRGTVQAVAHGKRLEHIPVAMNAAATWVVPSGKPKRCPDCGSWVKMPCLACQLLTTQQTSCTKLQVSYRNESYEEDFHFQS